MASESTMNYWTFSWYMLGKDQEHIQTLRAQYPDHAKRHDEENEASDKRVAEYRSVRGIAEIEERLAKKDPAVKITIPGLYQKGEIVEAWSHGVNARYRITGSRNYSQKEVDELEDANDIFLNSGSHSFGELVGLSANQDWPLIQ